MPKLLSSRKIAAGSILGAALLGGGAAFAYPSGVPLTVSAQAAPSTDPAHPGEIAVQVTVTNGNPSCATIIDVDVDGAAPVTLPAGSPNLPSGGTMGTVTVYLPAGSSGRNKVSARTEHCLKGQKEHAHSRFVISNAMTTGPGTASAGDTYRADLSGFTPGTDVTVTATLAGSNPLVQVQDTDTANSKGEGKVHFKFPKGSTGTYTITTTVTPAGPTSPSYSVTVS